jgi:hypothetical protein
VNKVFKRLGELWLQTRHSSGNWSCLFLHWCETLSFFSCWLWFQQEYSEHICRFLIQAVSLELYDDKTDQSNEQVTMLQWISANDVKDRNG